MYDRPALLADRYAIADLLREMFQQSQWADMELDEGRAMHAVDQFIVAPSVFCQVLVKDDGDLVGVLIGNVVPSWWFFGEVAQDIAVYVLPSYRGHGLKLVRAFEAWAAEFESVKLVQCSVMFGGEQANRTGRLYTRMGFDELGGNFVKRI